MKSYNGDWKVIEGTCLAKVMIRSDLPDCLEKEHLLQISTMLRHEGFMPIDFHVYEYPIDGCYYIRDQEKKNIFCIAFDENEKTLKPTYTTVDVDEKGNNTFWCQTIKESIELMEC
ncbi:MULTISPECIES: hypothetical protein [unclassified Enterococcus]|uniref:hypothetical protein n=1 Tax=unclassified Enterococcus TaxID=2608891 RepID=UPI001CE2062E|nr:MULTISPECIES: hypothetical protein [unclassified Enterococcus]MCA5014562.1 hypothetical protein [Enterococcus sp. S23]MCA5017815.1 hypothetical protein [Enterococcus sp. S22(2020)]